MKTANIIVCEDSAPKATKLITMMRTQLGNKYQLTCYHAPYLNSGAPRRAEDVVGDIRRHVTLANGDLLTHTLLVCDLVPGREHNDDKSDMYWFGINVLLLVGRDLMNPSTDNMVEIVGHQRVLPVIHSNYDMKIADLRRFWKKFGGTGMENVEMAAVSAKSDMPVLLQERSDVSERGHGLLLHSRKEVDEEAIIRLCDAWLTTT